MAEAVDVLWPSAAPISGLVITRYDHVPPAYRAQPGRIEVVEAAHPVPDAAGLQAAQRITELVQGLSADDLVLCLISGGGSALLTLPADGVSLDDKRAINRALLRSGAAIDEMNCVRKHLSAIKGGRLAAACHPARVITLLLSDVPDSSSTACNKRSASSTTTRPLVAAIRCKRSSAASRASEKRCISTPTAIASIGSSEAVRWVAGAAVRVAGTSSTGAMAEDARSRANTACTAGTMCPMSSGLTR